MTGEGSKAPKNLRGILFALAAAALFSVMNGFMRMITQEVHPLEAVFLRAVFAALFVVPLFARMGLDHLRSRRPGLHAARIGFNAVAQIAFVWGVALTPLVEVSVIGFTSPLFVTVLAVVILGEVIRARRITALIVGFAGMTIMLRPGFAEVHGGMLSLLVSASMWSVALIAIKALARTDSALTITFYISLPMVPITLVPALFVWQTPTLFQLAVLALVGGLQTVGQLLFADACRHVDTMVLMPLEFTKLIWAYLLGLVMFAEVPDAWTIVGGLVIFASATYITIREVRVKRTARTETPEES